MREAFTILEFPCKENLEKCDCCHAITRMYIADCLEFHGLASQCVALDPIQVLACALPVILDSIVVSIPACHAGDRGSIPRRGDNLFHWPLICVTMLDKAC